MQPSNYTPLPDNSERLTRSEAARIPYRAMKHKIAVQTLAKRVGGGPVQLSGRWPVYTKGGCRRWVLSRLTRLVRSTAELHSNTAA